MKPFLHGKKTVDREPLRSVIGAHHPPAPSAHDHVRPAAAGSQVEVVKQGDKVTRIIVTCTCGERIEIDCLYPAGS